MSVDRQCPSRYSAACGAKGRASGRLSAALRDPSIAGSLDSEASVASHGSGLLSVDVIPCNSTAGRPQSPEPFLRRRTRDRGGKLRPAAVPPPSRHRRIPDCPSPCRQLIWLARTRRFHQPDEPRTTPGLAFPADPVTTGRSRPNPGSSPVVGFWSATGRSACGKRSRNTGSN